MHELQPDLVCEPPREEWQALAAENRRHAAECPLISEQARAELRAEISSQAAAYTRELAQRAPELQVLSGCEAAGGGTLIAAGHQPAVPHPGIVMKTLLLDAELRERGGQGINVVVDVDSGQGGCFIYPQPCAEGLCRQSARLGGGGSLYLSQRLADAGRIRDCCAAASQALSAAGLHAAAGRTGGAGECLARLAGWSVPDAVTALRRHWEGAPRYCDVPLSRLLALRGTGAFFSALLQDPESLSGVYNRVLDDYRRERRIENSANPFPNLRREGERWELPFWGVDTRGGTRIPLFARRSGGKISWCKGEEAILSAGDRAWNYLDHLPAGMLIAPRALPLSLYLRDVVSDLFVHGIGGSRYGACPDRFIEAYLRCSPPRHAVVSGTRYLFEEAVQRYALSRRLEAKRREIHFHPEKFMSEGLFSERTQIELSRFSRQKSELIEEIRKAKAAKQSAAENTRALRAVDGKVRALVDEALAARLEPRPDDGRLDVYFEREYPHFMFERRSFP